MTVDLNQLANQLASGLAQGQFTPPPTPTPSAGVPVVAGGRPDPRLLDASGPKGVRFTDGEIRLGSVVDHTLLDPAATRQDIEHHCAEAREHRVAAVCVNPLWVPLCAELLAGSGIAIASTIAFPFGAAQPATKAAETALVVRQGASEIETVLPLGQLKSAAWKAVREDVRAVVDAAGDALVKVILETGRLTPMEILRACTVIGEAGAGYVKTSTGFGAAGGATPEAVALVRLAVGDDLGVKASGGVRDAASAFRLIASGATRVGTSLGAELAAATGVGPRRLRDLMSIPAESAAPPHESGDAGRASVSPEPEAAAPESSPPREPPPASPHRVTPAWGSPVR